MIPERHPWWRRRSVQVCAGLLAVAVVVAAVVIPQQRAKDRLPVGASRAGDYSMSDGYRSARVDFTVPNATVRVSIELGRKGTRMHNDELQTVRAPGGGVLAAISWTSSEANGDDAGSRASRLRIRSGATAVVVDPSLTPRSALVSSTGDERPQKVVALPGKPSDVVLELDFAGRTQSVRVIGGRRVAGDFAGLYRAPRYFYGATQPVSIGRSQPAEPTSPFRWTGIASAGRASRLPYVEGLGWAPEGREWVIVRDAGYTMDTTGSVSWTRGDAYARYSLQGKPVASVELGGRAPEKVLGKPRVSTSYSLETHSQDYVFSVPTGDAFTVEATVSADFRRSRGDTRAPSSTAIDLRDSETYPAAVDPTTEARTGGAARGGDRFDDVTVFADQLDDTAASVRLPFGALGLRISVGTEAGERRHRVTAPTGSALVQVTWSTGMTFGVPPVWPAATAAQRRDPGTELTLVSGGHRYPLAQSVSLSDAGGSKLVVVQGDGRDAHVEARFAGRVERSRPGPAQPAAVRTDGFRACQDASDKVFSWAKCTVSVYRGPYVPGLGAAPAGTEWLVVHDASATRSRRVVSVYDGQSRGARYLPSGKPSVAVSMDGETSAARVSGADVIVGDAVRLGSRAWLVPVGTTATVRMRYRLPTVLDPQRTDAPDAPKTHEVQVGTTVVHPGDPAAA